MPARGCGILKWRRLLAELPRLPSLRPDRAALRLSECGAMMLSDESCAMIAANCSTENPMSQNQPDDKAIQIEGLADTDDETWRGYPLDEILIRRESRTINDILQRISRNRYVMNPDFQRDFLWTEKQQSRLIESIIMRVPLPVLYLAEDKEGRMIVVDGLQRLSTFKRFVDNELKLKLPDRDGLNGKHFKDLAPKLQNRIEDCNLILYIIDERAPEQARLDIFERVNSGVPLTRQQMRNSLYTGEATRFLSQEARNDLFIEATGESLKSKTMRDREFVNRFCAFQILDIGEYRDMDQFLAAGLQKMNKEPEILTQMSVEFRISLRNNLQLFGKHAFRRHAPDQSDRNPLNASLWDVMSTGFSRYSEATVERQSDSFRRAVYQLLDDEEFVSAITYGPNSPGKVEYRFSAVRKIFGEVVNA